MTSDELKRIKQRYRIVGNDPKLNHAIETAVQVADSDLNVLVTGETGVGKEVFHQIIHDLSPRKNGPHPAINCGAIPAGTIDSELFGHVKGAFTDAHTEKKGYFELANGGTLFLDEVGELPLSTQVSLLRVLETGEFWRVGAEKGQKTDVRIVAATNRDLWQAVKEGKFREDLYYRLCVVEIRIPPLRERRDDIPMLFRALSQKYCDERHLIGGIHLTPQAEELLKRCYWGGNIRQLKNRVKAICVMERDQREITEEVLSKYLKDEEMSHTPVLASTPTIDSSMMAMVQQLAQKVNELSLQVQQLQQGYSAQSSTPAAPIHIQSMETTGNEKLENIPYAEEVNDALEVEAPKKLQTREEIERQYIVDALQRCGGNKTKAAKELGIPSRTFYRKLEKYGLTSKE